MTNPTVFSEYTGVTHADVFYRCHAPALECGFAALRCAFTDERRGVWVYVPTHRAW